MVNVFALWCFATEWAHQRHPIMSLGRVQLSVLPDAGLSFLLMTCLFDYFSAADRFYAKHNVSNAIGLVGCLPSTALVSL